MKIIAAALIATSFAMPGLSAAQFVNPGHESVTRGMSVPSGVLEKYWAQGPHAPSAPAYPTKRPDGTHRHQVTAVIVFVPAIGSVSVPSYYGPATPLYVNQDPPADAYRDLNGFYYWCPYPSGYYPYQLDCPMGWRLVAP